MPTRPDTHVIDDMAVLSVMYTCIQCGWACEVVHKDYGEDVFAQPVINGKIQPYRIWIQVKGTKNINNKNYFSQKYGYSKRVTFDHAVKWARSADLVVVVLWDVNQKFGLWTTPKGNVETWGLHSPQSGKARLHFHNEALFNKGQLIKIGWLACFDHYFGLVSKAIAVERHVVERNGILLKSEVPLIALDFLEMIGVLKGKFPKTEYSNIYDTSVRAHTNIKRDPHYRELLDEDYLKSYEAAFALLQQDQSHKKIGDILLLKRQAVEIALQEILRKISGGRTSQGVSRMLIEVCGRVAFRLILGFDPTNTVAGSFTENSLF